MRYRFYLARPGIHNPPLEKELFNQLDSWNYQESHKGYHIEFHIDRLHLREVPLIDWPKLRASMQLAYQIHPETEIQIHCGGKLIYTHGGVACR